MSQSAIPIVETIAHPPLGWLGRELIVGSFTGTGDLDRDTGAAPPWNHVNANGLTWDFFTVPARFGYTLGNPRIYEHRMIQLSTVHTGSDNHELVSEFHDFYSEGLYWMWENAGPTRIHYEIAPGVVVIFFWLLPHLPLPTFPWWHP
jgi:hypothetical protein